jgi:hypothetical protein
MGVDTLTRAGRIIGPYAHVEFSPEVLLLW